MRLPGSSGILTRRVFPNLPRLNKKTPVPVVWWTKSLAVLTLPPRNTDDTTSIDIDVLHRIAQDWYQRLKLHEIDDSTIQLEVTSDGLKVTLYHGDDKPVFESTSSKLSEHGRKVMQRMSWLLSQHVLAYRIDSHSMDLADKVKNHELAEWELSSTKRLKLIMLLVIIPLEN